MNAVIGKQYGEMNVEEKNAAAAITPGHLIERTSADTYQVHSTAGGIAFPMFALIDALQGKSISEAYAVGDPVRGWIPRRGDIVNALLADGQSVNPSTFLESAGDGTLRAHTADYGSAEAVTVQPIVGRALQTLDLSGASSLESSAARGAQRLLVEIL